MLDTIVVQNGSLLISSARTKFSNDAKVTDEDTKEALISLVQSVVDEIKK